MASENAQLLEQRQRQLDRVSELRQFSEEIIESSPAGIAVVDGASRIVTVNGAFADLMGHTREKLKGRALGTLIPLELFPHQGEPPAEVEFVDLHQKQMTPPCCPAPSSKAPPTPARLSSCTTSRSAWR